MTVFRTVASESSSCWHVRCIKQLANNSRRACWVSGEPKAILKLGVAEFMKYKAMVADTRADSMKAFEDGGVAGDEDALGHVDWERSVRSVRTHMFMSTIFRPVHRQLEYYRFRQAPYRPL